ncbi:hypothetical protein N2152v2_008466 [Parachlorella kessleri]
MAGFTTEQRPRRAVDHVRTAALGVLTALYVLEFIPRWVALFCVVSWTLAARLAARKLAAQLEAQLVAIQGAAAAGLDLETGLRADALEEHPQQPHVARLGGVAADFVVDLLNLRLTLLDRDFDARDYALLMALDESSGRYHRPAPEDQLSALPIRLHHTVAEAAATNTCSTHSVGVHFGSAGRTDSCYGSCKGIGHEVAAVGVPAAQALATSTATCCVGISHPGHPAEQDAVCAICLEEYADGDKVLTLPCHHDFHATCVKQWLCQQGASAFCPMCKAAVFRLENKGCCAEEV